MNNINLKSKLRVLKEDSGNHSPSIETLKNEIPDFNIKIDACFLSNPYATDLFLDRLDREVISSGKLRDLLEFYPPQNRSVAKHIATVSKINHTNIFVGNGAIEIIQAVLHRFVKKKLCVIIPTFSSYYEFVRPDTEVFFFNLKKEEDFYLDPEKLIKFIYDNQVDSLVLINPNNPNGGYIDSAILKFMVHELRFLDCLIVDESFIHFAYESYDFNPLSAENLVSSYNNLVVVKSMSKDFGIAGLRAGYAVMSQERVNLLLGNGYLWNISGLTGYFFKLYSDPEFLLSYELTRKNYIANTLIFIEQMRSLRDVRVYSSKANFVLLELENKSSYDFTTDLLIDQGIYVRDCGDKIGLQGQFIRVASRTVEENIDIVYGMRTLLEK